MSPLVVCEILGLFVNILTGDDKYSLCYRQNLSETIQMQLSKRLKIFLQFIAAFLESSSNFEHFGKQKR